MSQSRKRLITFGSCGSWFEPKFASEKVPTVEEVLELVAEYRQHDVLVAVDLKAEKVAQDVVRLAKKHGVLDRLLFIGWTISAPQVRAEIRAGSDEAHAAAVANNSDEFAGATVAADLPENWQQATNVGINGVLTDYPFELAAMLRQKE